MKVELIISVTSHLLPSALFLGRVLINNLCKNNVSFSLRQRQLLFAVPAFLNIRINSSFRVCGMIYYISFPSDGNIFGKIRILSFINNHNNNNNNNNNAVVKFGSCIIKTGSKSFVIWKVNHSAQFISSNF